MSRNSLNSELQSQILSRGSTGPKGRTPCLDTTAILYFVLLRFFGAGLVGKDSALVGVDFERLLVSSLRLLEEDEEEEEPVSERFSPERLFDLPDASGLVTRSWETARRVCSRFAAVSGLKGRSWLMWRFFLAGDADGESAIDGDFALGSERKDDIFDDLELLRFRVPELPLA